MKRLRFNYETKLTFSGDITDHHFSLRCIPFSDGRQLIAEPIYQILPDGGKIWHSRDSFGNPVICGRMEEPHSVFSFRVSGVAQIMNSYEAVGSATVFYGFQTPLTKSGEGIFDFYEKHKPQSHDILGRALLLSDSLYHYMTYQKGVTQVSTPAEKAFQSGQGVCQDYAHIFLSLLRLDHIRCRYVAGLAFSCGETHAWVEIYDGNSWIGMDPTHNCLIGDQYIKLCHGRDFADCPIERGIYRGNVSSTQEVISRVESI